MSATPVPLNRSFSTVPENTSTPDEYDASWWSEGEGSIHWANLLPLYRVVILSDAGSGKTYELEMQAVKLAQQGRNSFFIRLEDLDSDFENAFEVGDSDQFHEWQTGNEEAWFFLDSVDEAKLENPRAFEKAIKQFARRVKSPERAHIFISSRPYSWRFKTDKHLIERYLGIQSQGEVIESESVESDNQKSSEPKGTALQVFSLNSLGLDEVKQFAEYRLATGSNIFIDEVLRANLLEMAARPFDLDGLILKWQDDKCLGTRLQLLEHNIDSRLVEINPDKGMQKPLSKSKAREGARLLAAAALLTGNSSIHVPDAHNIKSGIEVEQVLPDWTPIEINTLLDSAIFNGVVYGAVRFRHREIRELLAAEWFAQLLKSANSRSQIESLIFRVQYGVEVIAPLVRPILPWLILLDDEIRIRALQLHPEIAVEGGDVASLPLHKRKTILKGIVEQIANNKDDRNARDNGAILRIALPDLSEDARALVFQYQDNDEAIFFLGRLAWQGAMTDCVDCFWPIALDTKRSEYTRVAAVRAIVTTGTLEQAEKLWAEINQLPAYFPRQLLSEFVKNKLPIAQTLKLLMASIDKLEIHKKYSASGLTHTLGTFLNSIDASAQTQLLIQFIDGASANIQKEPYLDSYECEVSAEHSWLMGCAIKAIEKLLMIKHRHCFTEPVLGVLIRLATLRDWTGIDSDVEKNNLSTLIPSWPVLNDAFFWRTVQRERLLLEYKEKPLVSAWPVQLRGYAWRFDVSSFERVIKMINDQEGDDQQVAFSLALDICGKEDAPTHYVDVLKNAVAGSTLFTDLLNEWLNPIVSPEREKVLQDREERALKREQKQKNEKEARVKWIDELKVNPDVLRNYEGLQKGEWLNYHYWLTCELMQSGSGEGRGRNGNWRALENDFGIEVAFAFRDSAVGFWRHYKPELLSDGTNLHSVPYMLVFAIIGLEIESREVQGFPKYLSEVDAHTALRYVPRELNGIPDWFESVYRAHKDISLKFICEEILSELECCGKEGHLHYVLYSLSGQSTWIHSDLVKPLQEWLVGHDVKNLEYLKMCMGILINGGVSSRWIADFSKRNIHSTDSENLPYWYATWVDAEAETGIPAVVSWLDTLDSNKATEASQTFIVCLLSEIRPMVRTCFNSFKTAEHLKTLYVLTHKHIRIADDIDRSGGGVYSPSRRDNAQDAREQLVNILSGMPGKQAYYALLDIAQQHPSDNGRAWLERTARKRAEQDADLDKWSASQVCDFANTQGRTPITHRQLFDLGVQQLTSFKDWCERGNDSQAALYQKAENEDEVRQIIAYWLHQNSMSRYECIEEQPLANNQRPDILLKNGNVTSPVPIELKLLDKGWAGSKLCERLRNQLVGDYLREEGARCGVFLLVWQGLNRLKKWDVEGERVGIHQLQASLEKYWQGISMGYPKISALEIIVVDLSLRASKSNS